MICRKLFTTLIAVYSVLTLATSALAADLNGAWKGQVEFPDGITRELTYTLKVDNGKLNGTIESPRGKIDISDGKVNGDEFTFKTVRDGNTIEHEGKLIDGKIKITVHAPNGDREYYLTPTKVSKVVSDSNPSPTQKSPVDVTGQWKGSIKDDNGGDIDLTYNLKADGSKLSGTVEGPAGTLNLENGTIDSDQLKFQISFSDHHILHEGALDDGKIKITTHMPQGDRTYTISRFVDLAGPWETKFTTPDGTDIFLKYDFKIDGNKLAGTVESPRGKLDLKDGKVAGEAIFYTVTIADNNVSYEGKLIDGKIKVKSHGGPFGDREYTLTRPVVDISGAWEATFKDETGNDLLLKFDLKVDGEKLTGTVQSAQGDGTLSNGTVRGDDVSFDVEFNNESIKHKGKIADKQIKLKVNGFGAQWDLILKRPTAK